MNIKKFSGWLGLSLSLIVGCELIEPTAIQNLNNNKILIIGHGGSGFQSYFNPLPANSFISASRAVDALQADGVELDAQLTADKKLVLYHDEFLETQTNCAGCVTGQTAAEVLQCRYNRDAGTNLKEPALLITLETVLAKFAAYEKKPHVFIDTKLLHACDPQNLPRITDFAEAVASLVAKYQAQTWTHVESSSVPLLLALKARDSRLQLSYYTRQPAVDIAVAANLNLNGITAFSDEITADQVQQAHRQNLLVTLLGGKSRSGLIETIKKNPDAIQTDNIPLLINILQPAR
jgi:glycerophosphoryl diester phosphodiesterase